MSSNVTATPTATHRNETTMTQDRRTFLLEAGEPLLLCRSGIQTAMRLRAFTQASGLPSESVLSSSLCAMPLPIYADFGIDEHGRTRRRWAGTRPEMMWHPLMWLPDRLAGRYTIADSATGTSQVEDDELWAIRVAFELTTSGLYDPETGGWIDVLATVGIDVDDDLDLARVQDWLSGYPDEMLDRIDLGPYLELTPASWALEAALAMRHDLEAASWALIADDLIDLADATMRTERPLGHTDTLMALRSLAGLSSALLSSVPARTETGASTGADSESHAAFFDRLHDLVSVERAEPAQMDADDYIAQCRERLYAIRDAFWPHLEALDDTSGDEAAAAPLAPVAG